MLITTEAPRAALALFLAVALSAMTLTAPASAQRGQWERIASKKVNMLADRDVIELDRTDGRFNALRFNAVEGNINIYRIRVTFGNGEKQDLDVNRKIREGEDTGAIDLKGRARAIDRIEMLYASSNLLKRAQLDIFGRALPGSRQAASAENHSRRQPVFGDNTEAGDTRNRRVPDFGGDAERDDTKNDASSRTSRRDRRQETDLAAWKKLGQRFVDLEFDRDRIWVGLNEGPFDRIRLRAKGGDIRLIALKVVYGNGQVDDIPVGTLLRNGTMTRSLDLKGRHRGIRRIEMVYRRGATRSRPVFVEVFGRPAQPKLEVSEAEDSLAENGWQVLGIRDVDLALDRDSIAISRGEGPFDAIALRARGNAVMVYDVRVTFGNGRRQTFRVDERLRPGRRSKSHELKGSARRITRVEMLYEKARQRGRRATVEVLARKVDRRRSEFNSGTAGNQADEDGAVVSEPIPSGWSQVGRRVLDRNSTDGAIGPASEVERFSEIVFRVTGAPIRIRMATIRFGNGRTMRLRINGRFRDGDKTNPINLKGAARRIEGIELEYDPIRGRDRVMVEVIGRKAGL